MDEITNYRTLIFNSAKDGKLERVKIFLDGRPKEWINECLNGHYDSTPPLVIAARNGHAEVVEYLVCFLIQ